MSDRKLPKFEAVAGNWIAVRNVSIDMKTLMHHPVSEEVTGVMMIDPDGTMIFHNPDVDSLPATEGPPKYMERPKCGTCDQWGLMTRAIGDTPQGPRDGVKCEHLGGRFCGLDSEACMHHQDFPAWREKGKSANQELPEGVIGWNMPIKFETMPSGQQGVVRTDTGQYLTRIEAKALAATSKVSAAMDGHYE
jgi:hypothetical protein